jgi:hypothetical protein
MVLNPRTTFKQSFSEVFEIISIGRREANAGDHNALRVIHELKPYNYQHKTE